VVADGIMDYWEQARQARQACMSARHSRRRKHTCGRYTAASSRADIKGSTSVSSVCSKVQEQEVEEGANDHRIELGSIDYEQLLPSSSRSTPGPMTI